MDSNFEPSTSNDEPNSCPQQDNTNDNESTSGETAEAMETSKDNLNESKNCLNVISNEEKQYDNCHEIVDIYEQESKQQMTNTNINALSEIYQRNLSPVVDLPTLPNAEEILKSNEVLSSTFDTSMYSDEDTLTPLTYDTLQSSPSKVNITDAEACLTRECTVSLPIIDNLLSQSDENGRTDVGKMAAEVDELDNSHSPNDADDNQENFCYASVSQSCTDQTTWNDDQNSDYNDLSYSDCNTSIASCKSNLKRCGEEDEIVAPTKKSKKGITFDSVSVYYFPRTQGFTCIPSQGGSTLGMSWNHSHTRKFSLGEHAAEQRRAHRQFCSQQFSNTRNWNEMSTISSEDSDSDEIISDSEMDYENYNFLQPIPTRERRAMLRASGIQKIDSTEKDECRSIRLSREFCGCTCQIYCDPERCVCAQAGIKCQVDRMNFPCSCTREGCANENGRIEFNPVRVRTHYIHTLMRLEIEKKKEEEEQRNKIILSNMDANAQLSYSNASLELGANKLMNYSYHNDLQSYYSQSSNVYGASTASSIVNSCFNFTYASNDQFVLPSTATATAVSNVYHESMSHPRIPNTNEYCCTINNASAEQCYSNDLLKEQDNQNFVIRDLTNGSQQQDESNVPYTATQSNYMQINEDFVQAENTTGVAAQNLDTSAETSEETEKEESDSENFGNIIKKTMVESVIA